MALNMNKREWFQYIQNIRIVIKLKANKKKYNEKTINKLRRSICDGIICGKDSKIRTLEF